MIIVIVDEMKDDEKHDCMDLASSLVVGTFRDDQKKDAIARASSEWNALKGEIITCNIYQEGSEPTPAPANKYTVNVQLRDAQGAYLRTIWQNGREIAGPTKTGAEDIPNPSGSSGAPSGLQIAAALALVAGVAYGTYRVTDAMIAPKDRRPAMNPAVDLSKLTKPTVHLNGTSANSLVEQYMDASIAIDEALKALSDAGPNGRDYYPQGNEALKQATAEHVARVRKLEEVRDEMNALAEYVAGLRK